MQEPLPIVFVSDENFLSKILYLMRPLPTQQLTLKRIFNYPAKKSGKGFWIMSSRFTVFRRPLAVKRSTADEAVKACTVTKRLGVL